MKRGGRRWQSRLWISFCLLRTGSERRMWLVVKRDGMITTSIYTVQALSGPVIPDPSSSRGDLISRTGTSSIREIHPCWLSTARVSEQILTPQSPKPKHQSERRGRSASCAKLGSPDRPDRPFVNARTHLNSDRHLPVPPRNRPQLRLDLWRSEV